MFNDRVEFEDTLTTTEVEALIADRDLKVLQCSKPAVIGVWFGSDKSNSRFTELVREHNLEPWQVVEEFEFV